MTTWEIVAVSALGGVMAAIVGYGLWQAAKTIWNILKSFEASLREAVKLTKAFHEDFAIVRQYLGVLQPQPASPSGSEEEDGSRETAPPVRSFEPFPAPVLERFRQEEPRLEKEAEIETGDVTGNETDLLDAERIESLREAGFTINVPETDPPGRTVDAP